LFLATALEAGIVGSPHDYSPTGPWTQAPALAPSGTCSACHRPHGAQALYLWVRNLSGYSNPSGTGKLDIRDGVPSSEPNFLAEVTVQCYDCHDYHNTAQFESPNTPALSLFNTNHRPQDILFGFTKNSTGNMTEYDAGPQAGKTIPGYYETDPPGTSGNFGVNPSAPLSQTGGHYFQQDPTGISGDGLDAGGKLPCSDCHDPHAWNSNWQAFVRPYWPVSSPVPSRLTSTVQASSSMANAPTPTSPGRSDVNSRKICIACHGTADTLQPVFFNEIQEAYRSDVRIARPPTIAAEHFSASQVACTSCHAHNSVGASCSSCHGFPPSETASPAYPVTATSTFVPAPAPGANDSHPRHFGRGSGARASVYEFNCEACHYGSSGIGAATLLLHQNSLVSVVLQGIWSRNGGAYDNTNYYNQGGPKTRTGQLDNTNNVNVGWGAGARYGGNTCENVYCHSAGRAPASMGDNDYRRPLWNAGVLGCDGCHGPGTGGDAVRYGMPNYASGGAGAPTANSHAAHVVTGLFECSVCHAGTVAGAGLSRAIMGTTPSLHVNRQREVQFSGGASGSYDNLTKSCSVSCHGADTPRWGGSLTNGCFSCHAGTEQLHKPQNDYATAGAPNPVDNAEYLYSGHGRSGSNYPGSGNLPAGFSNYTTAPASCYVCHSQAAPHTTKSANDPFRLGSGTDGTLGGFGGAGGFTGAWADNTDALCVGCHGTAAQRSGHDNAASGTTTVDALTHARQAMNNPKYTWPGPNYPWKCVDCHDPHGDGKSGAERIMMVRSGINAPVNSADANAGSAGKSRPRRTDANVRSVTFTSLAGYGAGSYAQPGNGAGGTWGPCEVCHTQTNAYSRTRDNDNTHVTRITRCSTCHPHKSGFAATACKGCHGPDSVATADAAPNVGTYWTSSGHGMAAINIDCEACHDVGFVSGADHKADGSAGVGPPPANINTLFWPGKSTGNPNTDRNQNTAHLKSDYFPAGFPANPPNKYQYALAFDQKCGNPATGCHTAQPHYDSITAPDGAHPQRPAAPVAADNVLTFGQSMTTLTPKAYNWFPAISDYPAQFYQSRSPWDIEDITTNATTGYPGNGVRYGLCVSCHDPHGTNAPSNRPGHTTNVMLRGDTLSPPGQFCNTACHRSP